MNPPAPPVPIDQQSMVARQSSNQTLSSTPAEKKTDPPAPAPPVPMDQQSKAARQPSMQTLSSTPAEKKDSVAPTLQVPESPAPLTKPASAASPLEDGQGHCYESPADPVPPGQNSPQKQLTDVFSEPSPTPKKIKKTKKALSPGYWKLLEVDECVASIRYSPPFPPKASEA